MILDATVRIFCKIVLQAAIYWVIGIVAKLQVYVGPGLSDPTRPTILTMAKPECSCNNAYNDGAGRQHAYITARDLRITVSREKYESTRHRHGFNDFTITSEASSKESNTHKIVIMLYNCTGRRTSTQVTLW